MAWRIINSNVTIGIELRMLNRAADPTLQVGDVTTLNTF